MNKDKLYHQIALACLKTLREGQGGETEDHIQALYQSIDDAFEQQAHLLMVELADAKQRLHTIAHLDDQHTLEDARVIAGGDTTSH